jgi:hypothetical protein
MYTAMAVVALTLSVTSGKISPTPAWLDDYQVAQARVADAGKPMAIVIGSGQAGWQTVVRDGGFDPAVTQLLAEKFVCLYADTTTAKGRQLSDALQVRRGVVISDKTGRSQAFSASGTMSRTALASALARYADQPEIIRTEVQTTTTGPAPVTAAPGGVVVQPGMAVPPGMVVQPGMAVPPAPVMPGAPAGACCPPTGGYAMGAGGCCGGGYSMGGCGKGGHGGGCGLFGGGWGGGMGGCGGGYSAGCGMGGGHGCCGMFGGMFGGWGGGCGGGWGHGGGCCK